MKKIGIIGAMAMEVSTLKEEMFDSQQIEKAGMIFYYGSLQGCEVVVVQSGIGKVNAAACTQLLIDLFQVDCVINTGVAGSLDNNINVGDIVISTDAVQHDMSTSAGAFGDADGQIPGLPVFSFVADEELRKLAVENCQKYLTDIQVFQGRVLTGDIFLADHHRKEALVQEFAGICVEMEGAAIAHVAYLNQLPFLIIRAISDKADGSAHTDFPTFAARAAERSVELLLHMLSSITQHT